MINKTMMALGGMESFPHSKNIHIYVSNLIILYIINKNIFILWNISANSQSSTMAMEYNVCGGFFLMVWVYRDNK